MPNAVTPVIFALGDLHLPFLHKPTWDKILTYIFNVRPEYIVFMGDCFDMYSFNKFGVRLSFSAKDEMDEGRSIYEEMLTQCKLKSPKSKIYVLRGNHDERGLKRLYEAFGPKWRELCQPIDFWSFPGVNVVSDPSEVLELKQVLFTHGHRKFGTHSPNMGGRKVCIGHLHIGDTKFFRDSLGNITWEHCCGLLGDPFHDALAYRPLKKYFNWHHGLTIIDNLGPRFIPMEHVSAKKIG